MLTTLFYHGPRVAEVCAQRLVEYIQAEHRLTRQEQAVEHFALIEAIVEGDFLGAASKMREHLDGAHRTKTSLFSDLSSSITEVASSRRSTVAFPTA
jgi:DNA-binding FadR family transcriptional regulator